jgi:hypothetical protein
MVRVDLRNGDGIAGAQRHDQDQTEYHSEVPFKF